MAASRKLQGEIDLALKKVQEGLDFSESLWNKVYQMENVNMKEKYKSDLRKEIRKLQKHRDPIKYWLQSNDIKDKEHDLTEARKRIETEMERLKIFEKETMTKAFSKEGLEQQPKTDPKEKAKSETRDWLNNTVSELESQIEIFEAEKEGLSVKKGKTRPPRPTHLESSISRHKAHIMKLELILRLLDNDELSPEQVNEVKDILDDYVERNQEDFDEFDDVDTLYNTLPFDKLESLEDLVAIRPPVLAKGVGATGAAPSIKSPLRRSKAQKDRLTIRPPGVVKGVGAAPSMKSPFSRSESQQDLVTIHPPVVVKGVSATGAAPSMNSLWSMSKAQLLTSAIATPSFQHQHADGMAPNPPPKNSETVSAPLTSAITQTSPVAVGASSVLSSPIDIAAEEEDVSNFPGRKPSSFIPGEGLRDLGGTNLPSITIPTTSGGTVSSHGSFGVASGTPGRSILGGDDRLGSGSIVQPLISPVSSRMTLPPSAKTSDVFSGSSSCGNGEAGGRAGRVFPPYGAPRMQWRPGQPFQSQQIIKIETREEFSQRFHQVQQKGQGNNPNITSLSGGNHKHFTAQQDPLIKQFNSRSSAASPQGMLVGGPAAGLTATTSAQQQPSSINSLSGQNTHMASGSKDTEPGHVKAAEAQQRQNLSDESATSSVLDKNTAIKDDSKASYTSDAQAGVSSSVTDPVHFTRDTDLSHDQKLQLLESSFHKLPRRPAKTPQSYPQEQDPIVGNPDFWKCLGSNNIGLDTLFFAFYHQQNTNYQYLAARELKQSWRYHKKLNKWFYLPKEQPIIGDGYAQGTYMYFDHQLGPVGNDGMQNGWCRKTGDFRFHSQDFEDELVEDSCNNNGH